MANPDCKDVLNLIPLYIDNMLSKKESDIVSQHIKSCKKCKEELALMKSLTRSIKDTLEVDLPEDFHKKLMMRVENDLRRKKTLRNIFMRRIGAGVAAAAALVLSLVALSDFVPHHDKQNSDIYLASDLSKNPINITAPTKESKALPIDNTDKKPHEATQKSNDAPLPDKAEANLPVSISLDENTPCVFATVSAKEDIKSAVLEILSSYEKDETGYIVNDFDDAIARLKELGAKITFKTDDALSNNYIVLE